MSVPTSRLIQLEVVIGGGLRTFVAVGQALLEIRDDRLYREQGHKTFEDYTQQRWGFTRQRAAQLIEATEIVTALEALGGPSRMSTTVDTPTNEAQARELAPMKEDSEAMGEAWEESLARSEGKPTAAVVRQVVRERREPSASAQAMAAGIDHLMRSDPELTRLAVSEQLSRVLSAAMRVNTEATADYWLDRLGPDDIDYVRSVLGSLRRWIDSWEAALAAQKPLRVVGGRS